MKNSGNGNCFPLYPVGGQIRAAHQYTQVGVGTGFSRYGKTGVGESLQNTQVL